MSLSPEQRDDLRALLAGELKAAWGTDGPPEAIIKLAEELRRAVESEEDSPAQDG